MKQPGFVLHHLGDDYLLVEGGFNADTRTVTVLCEPGNERFPQTESMRPVTWRDQGEWFPVARWSPLDLMLQDPEHEEQRVLLLDLVERYLDERPEPEPIVWTLADEHGVTGSLETVLPMGLAAPIFDDEERARQEADESGQHLVPVHSPLRFLTYLTREGYAGAMWNRMLPVYACIDDAGDLHFLRVGRAGRDKVELEILGADEAWDHYDGEESIEFLEQREACDARLVESLGRRPLLGWPVDGALWSVGPSPGAPGLVTLEDDHVAYGLLFSTRESADDWAEDADEGWVSWPVSDLPGFLSSPDLSGCASLLNPGAHRVSSGVLWADGPRVVLDSFSGFWALGVGGEFSSLD
ncbi:MAG: hypothetical protein H6825_13090 [Planctomycetes bacterium]|nr:hypothetical protein [Planctomycetota bacterium]